MRKLEDTRHSILCISASEKLTAVVRRSLDGFVMMESRRNIASGRRCAMERYYDMVVINAPLPDEFGEQFALDLARDGSASVLLVTPPEAYEEILEHVTDFGIMVLSKPLSADLLTKAIRYLAAIQNRIHAMEDRVQAAHEKMEEMRIVNKAKFMLVERRHMTEDEAHRLIGKQAMDHGVSRKRIAEGILEEFDE